MGGANERDELDGSIVEMDWKNGFEGWIGGMNSRDGLEGLRRGTYWRDGYDKWIVLMDTTEGRIKDGRGGTMLKEI